MAETNATYLPSGNKVYVRDVWFTGSTALEEGQGVCFDSDQGTATDADGSRYAEVELPSANNNNTFAGVAVQDYSAVTGGRRIKIYEPGSVCNIAINVDSTVIASGSCQYLTCSCSAADAGLFVAGGFYGRGSARVLQTNASGTLATNLDGTASVNDTTLTHASAFGSVTAGDYVYILAGTVTASGATAVTDAKYTASAVATNTITLNSAASAAASACAYTVRSATAPPKCLAVLLDGVESGLVQYVSAVNNASSEPAPTIGGTTIMVGGVTIAADTTATLADGTYVGQTKRFALSGALTTQDWLITVTSGLQSADSSTLATLELDADADNSMLLWTGTDWQAFSTGPTEA